MFKLPEQPGTIGNTLDAGFKLYFKSFKYIVLFTVLFAVVGLLPSFLHDPTSTWDQSGQNVDELLNLYGTLVITQLINNVFIIAMLHRMHSLVIGDVCSIGSAFSVGIRKFLPMVFLNILYTLAWLAGTILLIVPGVFISIAFIYSGLALVTENRGPIDALGRSWDMVRNNWWRTLIIVSVAMIIYFVLLSILGFVFTITISMSSPDGFFEYAFFLDIANGIIVLLIIPLLAAIMIAGFNDLVIRREGADMEKRILELSTS